MPRDAEDTHLALLLHSAGRVPLEQLNPLLERVRAARIRDPGASLESLLVNSGLVSAHDLDEVRREAAETLRDSERAPILPAKRPAQWRVGARIAGYTLQKELGRGGMGVVMQARQEATGRQVALKCLLYDDIDAVQRFTREASAQASVDDHPNVVRVYEAGEADGYGYLAMELLSGGDLATRLRRGQPLPAEEAARVVAQLARGLAHVHAQGILHRDLKPHNVLFDADGTPKLVDFGLARVLGAESLTRTGQVLGTPAFMAPEQALALNEVDARTDVYGLGAILYACLTGGPPFRGQLAEVLARVIADPPLRPASLVSEVDPRLEAICLRALAKDPGDRFPDAVSMAAALEGWRETGPGGTRGYLLGAAGLVVGLGVGFGLGLLVAGDSSSGAGSPSSPPPAPVTAPAQPPSPDPVERAADPANAGPPASVLLDDVELWSRIMIPLPRDEPDAPPTWHLAWVTAIEGEWIRAQVGGIELEVEALPEGFRRDGLGVGARALIHTGERTRRTPCVVRRRLGPVALVEFSDGDRSWVPVPVLGLLGAGVDPGEDAEAKIVNALWAPNEQSYPAVVVDRDPEESRVRVAYLDGDTAWIPSEELEPLPRPRSEVFFKGEDPVDAIPATLVRYPAPWLVEVDRADTGERVLLDLGRLIMPAD